MSECVKHLDTSRINKITSTPPPRTEYTTIDLRNQELISEVVYIDEKEGFVALINNQKFRLNTRQAYTLHNQFTTAVTNQLYKKMGV